MPFLFVTPPYATVRPAMWLSHRGGRSRALQALLAR